MDARPPSALLFDFGNVIAFFDHGRALAQTALRAGVSMAEIQRRAASRQFAQWVCEYEHGRLDDATFCRGCLDLLELRVSPADFARFWADIFWLNEPIAALIADLHDLGHRLILCSNTNALHAMQARRQFAPTLDRFDAFVLSHEVGYMKPRFEFYASCVRAAGVPASDCLFVDDLDENIAGARRAGLAAVHYRHPVRLRHDLGKLGINVSNRLDLLADFSENAVGH